MDVQQDSDSSGSIWFILGTCLTVVLLLLKCGTLVSKVDRLSKGTAPTERTSVNDDASLGMAYLDQGDYPAAIAKLTSALGQVTSRRVARHTIYLARGTALLGLDQLDQAFADFESGVRAAEETIALLANIGSPTSAKDKPSSVGNLARDLYGRPLAELHLGMAVVKEKQGDKAAALALYIKAKAQLPTSGFDVKKHESLAAYLDSAIQQLRAED